MKFKFQLLLCLTISLVTQVSAKPPVKVYSAVECKTMGLQPVIDANGVVVMPQDDGGFYQVAPNFVTPKVTEEQVKNFFEVGRQIGSVVDDILRFESQTHLPAIIQKKINGVTYEIGLEKLMFTPAGNVLSIRAMITTADQKHICFAGEDIGFTGQGGIREGTLELVLGGDAVLKFDKLKKIDLEIIKGALKFGCKGFESFSLYGNVIFDRTLIVPDDVRTGQVLAGNVRSAFKLVDVASWNDLLIEIDMQPFQLPNMPGYGFNVSRAVIDISDTKNAGGFSFPAGYTAAETGDLWQGAYIGEVSVRFPLAFKTRSGAFAGGRTAVGVTDLLIDRFGVSGTVFGENIFKTSEGDLNGWDYSLASASITLVKNKIKSGSLGGKMRVSIAGENSLMDYTAIIDPTRDYYSFTVVNEGVMKFDFLQASKVDLFPASSISLKLENQVFVATANLHGKLDITVDTAGVALESFAFEDLKISTKKPYLTIGYFGSTSGKEYSLGNFPISFKQPFISSSDEAVRLGFTVAVNLDDVGIAAEGGFFVDAYFVNENNRHYWKNKSIGLNSLGVKADLSIATFQGNLTFFKADPVYGKGFNGSLKMVLKTGSEMGIGASAVFGKTTERYWFVDGILQSGGGGGGFDITMLQGYLYKRMSPGMARAVGVTSITGGTYVPNFNVAWGGMFGLGLSVGQGESAVSGSGALEVAARIGGGIKSIGIMGKIDIAGDAQSRRLEAAKVSLAILNLFKLKPPESVTKVLNEPPTENPDNIFPSSPKGIGGSILLQLNFDEKSYYGKLGVKVNTSAVQVAAMGEFYFSPTKWFVHLGAPPLSDRILINFPSIPVIDGYIMVGHGLLEVPAPEPNIFLAHPAKAGERSTGISNSKGITGEGFAFGAALSLAKSGGYKNILAYSASVRAGLDLMVVKLGSNVFCAGLPGQLGLNGWLGSGQIYVIGSLAAKAFGIPVLSLQMGALLKGTAPNPTSGQGQVALKFAVLTKKYNFNMGVEFGDDCRLDVTDVKEENVEIISGNYPAEGATNISVKTEPYVSFTEDLDKTITLDGQDGEFRITVQSVTATDSKGNKVKGSWDVKKSDRTKLYFNPNGDLPGNEQLKVVAEVQVERKDGGSWVPVNITGGSAIRSKTFSFKTAKSAAQIEQEQKAAANAAKNAKDAAAAKAQKDKDAANSQKAYEADLERIKNSQAEQAKIAAYYATQLAAIENSTAAERAFIENAAKEAQRQLEEINENARQRAAQIEAKAAKEAEEIKQDNERKKNELDELIRQSNADAAHKAAAQSTADAAKAAADEAARRGEEYVQNIVNQAVADVANVTNEAKWQVDGVKNQAQTDVTNIGEEYKGKIMNLGSEKQARLNQIVADRKRLVNAAIFKVWPNLSLALSIRAEYLQKARNTKADYDNRINNLPGECAVRQHEVSQNAQNQMNNIVANARERADAIMNEAANKSEEAMRRARDTANNIMAQANQQCRDILGGGPAIVDVSGFAEALKAQNDAYDEGD